MNNLIKTKIKVKWFLVTLAAIALVLLGIFFRQRFLLDRAKKVRDETLRNVVKEAAKEQSRFKKKVVNKELSKEGDVKRVEEKIREVEANEKAVKKRIQDASYDELESIFIDLGY